MLEARPRSHFLHTALIDASHVGPTVVDMRTRTLVIAGASAVAIGSLVAGLIELDGAAITSTTASTTPITAVASNARTTHHRHHPALPGFAGSIEMWNKTKGVQVDWSWAKGTLDQLTSSQIELTEPNRTTFTAPIGPRVHFRGASQAAAESEHGVEVVVLERDSTVVMIGFPKPAKA